MSMQHYSPLLSINYSFFNKIISKIQNKKYRSCHEPLSYRVTIIQQFVVLEANIKLCNGIDHELETMSGSII